MAKMGCLGLAGGSSDLPEGLADRGQEGPRLLWPLQKARDAGLLRQSCRMSRTPPGEGREGIRKARSGQRGAARGRGPLPSLL